MQVALEIKDNFKSLGFQNDILQKHIYLLNNRQ